MVPLASSFDVAVTGDGLVAATPARPVEDEACGVRVVWSETVQEAMELGDADGDREFGVRVGI